MPLTRRHKRRLKEISRMIDSTITIRDDMVEINLEYAREIEEIILQIESSGSDKIKKNSHDEESTALSPEIRENQSSDSKKTDSSTGEHQSDANYEAPPKHVDNVPSWAKALWKKIAMKCHPDRLSFQKLSAIEIAKRQQYMLESKIVLEAEDWNKLLYIGVQIEEFVEELPITQQLSMLESKYNEVTSKVNDIQSSLAWKWGNNWDNFDLRVRIIQTCFQSKGLKIPPRDDILKSIIKFESE